jgi:hypothetical protein
MISLKAKGYFSSLTLLLTGGWVLLLTHVMQQVISAMWGEAWDSGMMCGRLAVWALILINAATMLTVTRRVFNYPEPMYATLKGVLVIAHLVSAIFTLLIGVYLYK